MKGANDPLKRTVFIEVGPLVAPEPRGYRTIIELYRNRMNETFGLLFRVVERASKLTLHVADFLHGACREEHHHKVRRL